MSGIAVLDVDEPEGSETLSRLDLSIPLTAQVNTPGGRHYIYKYDPNIRTGVAVVGKGIDIRSTGSFIVGAGSIVDGKEYVWHLTEDEVGINEAPDWMKIQKNGGRSNSKVDLSKKLGEGERNSGLTSIAGKLLYGGSMDEGLVYQVLQVCNQELCTVPLEDWEVESIFKSIRRYTYDGA